MSANIYGASILTLLEELWYGFYDTYVVNETAYENLDMNGMISVQSIIIGLYIGLSVAAVASVIGKRVHGKFVQMLLLRECLSPESAMTLPELDFADKLIVRYAVKRSVNLRRIVRCVEEEEYLRQSAAKAEAYEKEREENPKLPKKFKPVPFKMDLDNHRFYIPEELKGAAEIKFDQKGTSALGTALFVALLAVAFVLLLIFLPNILGALDGFIGSFK